MSYFLKNEFTYNPGVNYGPSGSTGEVSYPEHMESIHKDWLGYSGSPTAITTDFINVMETGLTNNPLESLSYSDPSTDITELDTEVGELETMVEGLDASADWTSIVDSAISKIDSAGVLNDVDMITLISNARTEAGNNLITAVEKALAMIDSHTVVKAAQQYARVREKQRAQTRTRYKAGMVNVNAQRGSSYAIGLALLEIEFERDNAQYTQEFSNQLYQQGLQFYANALSQEIQSRLEAALREKQTRDQMLNQSVQTILTYKQFTVQMKKILSEVMAEMKRITYVMDSEYTQNTADLNWKHSSWDMNVYKNGIAVLGGLGGGQFVPEGPSKTASALGGALSGAATGASVGTALGGPGIGTAIGAGVGLAAGLFS